MWRDNEEINRRNFVQVRIQVDEINKGIPLGAPVVPLVYIMIAVESACGGDDGNGASMPAVMTAVSGVCTMPAGILELCMRS